MTQPWEHQPRRQGRFAETAYSEAGDLDLGGAPAESTADILTSDADGLWAHVESGDPARQAAAARALALTTEQAGVLARHDQPFTTRWAVASRSEPGHARLAAADPDPVIRAQALRAGFDLSQDTVDALEADPMVARVRELVGAP